MPTTNAQIEQAVSSSILELINQFQNSPYTFLYESDLQATLFAMLRQALPEKVVVPGNGKPMQSYELAIAHTEYWSRIDIACIDVERAASFLLKPHKGVDAHIYRVPLLVGIELKYRMMGYSTGISDCLADMNKLRNLGIRCPVVLGFVQNEDEIQAFLSGYDAHQLPKGLSTDIHACISVIGPNSVWTVESPPK